jgi:hypothetical protein
MRRLTNGDEGRSRQRIDASWRSEIGQREEIEMTGGPSPDEFAPRYSGIASTPATGVSRSFATTASRSRLRSSAAGTRDSAPSGTPTANMANSMRLSWSSIDRYPRRATFRPGTGLGPNCAQSVNPSQAGSVQNLDCLTAGRRRKYYIQ